MHTFRRDPTCLYSLNVGFSTENVMLWSAALSPSLSAASFCRLASAHAFTSVCGRDSHETDRQMKSVRKRTSLMPSPTLTSLLMFEREF